MPTPTPATARRGRAVGPVLAALVVPQFTALGAPGVALPDLARSLGVPFGATAWVLAAWALTSAVAMPLAGRVVARRGPGPVLVGGTVTLAVGSVVAAAGGSLPVVVLGRLVGGAGAGAAVIAVFAVAGALATGERLRAVTVIAAAAGAMSASGTLVGGVLTVWLGWRGVLALPALALPVLVLLTPSVRRLLREAPALGADVARTGARVDLVGAGLVTVLAGAAVTLPQLGSLHLPWPVAAAVAVGAAGGLWLRTRAVPDGFVPRRVVRAGGFAVAGLAGATIYAGYYAVMFAAPALVEHATGANGLVAGAALLPAAACSVLAGRLVRPLARRQAASRVIAGLGLITSVGVLAVAAAPGAVLVVVGAALVVCGFAGAQAVLVALVPTLVERRDRDLAQGLFNFLAFLGGSLGPAAVGGLSAGLSVPGALAAVAALPLAGGLVTLAQRQRRVLA